MLGRTASCGSGGAIRVGRSGRSNQIEVGVVFTGGGAVAGGAVEPRF
ncbi:MULTISPECIES: hypothetical protein [Streptomyces]|uniref:Uncharacterized protein n=1 Tax=Streptomyces pratisoli TaxID=3139917 RepID=A0ACC6QI15_9ACTN|nr:hypothetical protein [Streptomyces sp. NBC_00259]